MFLTLNENLLLLLFPRKNFMLYPDNPSETGAAPFAVCSSLVNRPFPGRFLRRFAFFKAIFLQEKVGRTYELLVWIQEKLVSKAFSVDYLRSPV